MGWHILSKKPLPPTDIVPAPELEADLAIDTERFEAERLVQRHACWVRERDAGERGMKTAARQFREQNRIECATNAGAARFRRDVNRGVDRVAIGRSRGMLARVHIAGDFAVRDRDEVWIVRQR
jgi:hypothetical protein